MFSLKELVQSVPSEQNTSVVVQQEKPGISALSAPFLLKKNKGGGDIQLGMSMRRITSKMW